MGDTVEFCVISPAEFAVALEQRRKAKLRKAPVFSVEPELTDEQVRARMEFLAADNARIKAELMTAGHPDYHHLRYLFSG